MYDHSLVVKYHYKRLTMGVATYPENFQRNINDLFHGFKFIRAYIYDLLKFNKRILDRSCTEIGINTK